VEKKLVLRGLGSGALAGLLSFVFARIFAEPIIARAINYESAREAAQALLDKAAGIAPGPAGPDLFSRTVQEDIGIAVALVVFGAALGGLFAVVFTLVQRGSGSGIRPRTLALLIAGAAFVSVYLVPFLKYPANPPAIGHENTIETRGTLYLVLQVVSVVALVLAVQLGRVLSRTQGIWKASLYAGLAYAVVVGVTMGLLPSLGELQDNVSEFGRHKTETPLPLVDADGRIVFPGFPADDLYAFRLYALGGQLILWGAIGLLFGPLAENALVKAGLRAPGTRQPVLV
jgi:hypothetical protein